MFVLLDLETTGLDPNLETILEVAIAIVEDNSEVIATFSHVIRWDELLIDDLGNVIVPASVENKVVEMHDKNGLWYESAMSQLTMRYVETAAIQFLEDYGATDEPMAGNTINFDRSFLAKHMPRLEKTFHYRNYDISTLKLLGKKYGFPDCPKVPVEEDKAHRGLADVKASTAELFHYLITFDIMDTE